MPQDETFANEAFEFEAFGQVASVDVLLATSQPFTMPAAVCGERRVTGVASAPHRRKALRVQLTVWLTPRCDVVACLAARCDVALHSADTCLLCAKQISGVDRKQPMFRVQCFWGSMFYILCA